MDGGGSSGSGNYNRSFGAPYYRSADYRIRYPAYLRRVVPPPTSTVDVLEMLYPRQFSVRKMVTVAKTPGKHTDLADATVTETTTTKTTRTKRKSTRKPRRQTVEVLTTNASPLVAPLDGDYSPSVVADDGGGTSAQISTTNDTVKTATAPTIVYHTQTRPPSSRSTTVVPKFDDNYAHKYPATRKFTNPPDPLTFLTMTSKYKNNNDDDEHRPRMVFTPPPDLPPPPPPPSPSVSKQQPRTSTTQEPSFGHDGCLDPVERLKQTAKRFERECARQRRLTAEHEIKNKARAIAEQAKHVVTMAKRERHGDGGRPKQRTADNDKFRSRCHHKTSEYAELERLGLGKYDNGGRWVPHSKNKFKDKLTHFQ